MTLSLNKLVFFWLKQKTKIRLKGVKILKFIKKTLVNWIAGAVGFFQKIGGANFYRVSTKNGKTI